jgi:hypothetical protein
MKSSEHKYFIILHIDAELLVKKIRLVYVCQFWLPVVSSARTGSVAGALEATVQPRKKTPK